jgi:sulfatase modifying factor 1
MKRLCAVGLGVGLLLLARGTQAQSPPGLSVQLSNGLVWLRITGDVGTPCTIQYCTGLSATNDWQCLTNLAPLLGSPSWVADAGINTASRCYRAFAQQLPANMALIPAGSFTMGNCMDPDEGWTTELPLHTVSVSAFYMDKYLVTKSLWDTVKAWSGGNGYSYDYAGSGKASTHPVQRIDWFDMVKWCNARSQQEGLRPCYYTDAGLTVVYQTGWVEPYVNWSAKGYRLPTEAEWEKAARGGASGHRFPWSNGDTITHSQANYWSWSNYAYDVSPTREYHPTFADGVFPYTSPVGYFAANGYGLYDMAGNVWQWCWDWYDDWYYTSSPGTDPHGPDSSPYGTRVARGGEWGDGAGGTRCAMRKHDGPGMSSSYGGGFRCVRGG